MSMIESIRDFVCGCPYLKDGKLNVDYLGAEPTEYTIDGVPTSEVVRQYADGGAIKQYVFIFGSREYYGSKVIKNIENSGFYEKFADWLEASSEAGDLPELAAGKTAQRIEALSTGYLFDATANNARYQIQCRLLYYERGR